MTTGANLTPGSTGDDDRLSRALAALRCTDVPAGPSAEVLAQTLAAVEATANTPETPPRSWRRIMFATLKIAATILVATVGFFLVRNPRLVGAPVTFEEVAQKIQKAHTLAYTMTTHITDQGKPQSVRLLFKEPGRLRCEEVPASGLMVISDTEAAMKLILNPATKTAVLLQGSLPGEPKPGDPDIAASAVADLRRLADKKAESMGEKLIGTIRAQGFRAAETPGYETIVWVDPKTRLPVQVDMSGPFGDKTFHGTLTDIQLDPALEDALFSLEPPQGYTLQKQSLAAQKDKDDGTPEAAIITLLRAYAEKSSGAFPKRVDDWSGYGEALKGKPEDNPFAAAMRAANLSGRAAAFLFVLKGEYGYKPDGIKLGDADKILFWYKLKGKETYRAIFGDLHVADVLPDQLPAVEKPQSQPKP